MRAAAGAALLLFLACAPHTAPTAKVLTQAETPPPAAAPARPARSAPQDQNPSAIAPVGRHPRAAALPSSATPRFFFAGNGRLRLGHAHFNTMLEVRYRHADGSYDAAALKQIDQFFRSRLDGRERTMPLRLVELLSYVQERYRPKAMVLLSGYRSPEFNAELGAAGQAVAMASLHTQGLAADVAFSGVDLKSLWRQLRELKTGGVGFYKSQNFLHIDAGPPRFWEETTSRVGENLSAGNARMFVRTDYDRYEDLRGAVLSLQSVTHLPLQIDSRAALVSRLGAHPLTLRGRGAIARDGDCWAITTPAEAYELEIVKVGELGGADPDTQAIDPYIVVTTCAPRTERTPANVKSNPIALAPG